MPQDITKRRAHAATEAGNRCRPGGTPIAPGSFPSSTFDCTRASRGGSGATSRVMRGTRDYGNTCSAYRGHRVAPQGCGGPRQAHRHGAWLRCWTPWRAPRPADHDHPLICRPVSTMSRPSPSVEAVGIDGFRTPCVSDSTGESLEDLVSTLSGCSHETANTVHIQQIGGHMTPRRSPMLWNVASFLDPSIWNASA